VRGQRLEVLRRQLHLRLPECALSRIPIYPEIDGLGDSRLACGHLGLAPDAKENTRGRDVLELSREFMTVWAAHRHAVFLHESTKALPEIDDRRIAANREVVNVGEKQSRFRPCWDFLGLPATWRSRVRKTAGLDGEAGISVCHFPMLVVRLWQSPHRQKALDKDGVRKGEIVVGHQQVSDNANLALIRIRNPI
jgi:hypothetical protein